MLQLKDESFLCVYASKGNILLQKSPDAGRHWSAPVVVAGKEPFVNMDTPELLQLTNGDILLSYNGRPKKSIAWNTRYQ